MCTGPAFMEFKVGDECFCLLLSSERILLLLHTHTHTHTHSHTVTQPPKQTNKNPQIFPLFAALEDQAHLGHCSKAKHKLPEAKQYVTK